MGCGSSMYGEERVIKAKYHNIQRENGYEYKPIIEIHNLKSDRRSCNVCKGRMVSETELYLGCDNHSVVIGICEQCMVILHDLLSEYLEQLS